MRSCIRRQCGTIREHGRFLTPRRAFPQETSHPGSSFGRQQSSLASENGQDGPKGPVVDDKPSSLTSPDSIKPILGRRVPPGIEVAPVPLQTLPTPPQAPRYPCQHLSEAQLEQYLKPLYDRGWGIHSRLPMDDIPTTTFMLAKSIKFIWNFALVEFLGKLHPVVQREQHHPRVSYELRTLDIMMQTHSAFTVDGEHRHTVPGITLRDIRLAYAVEDILMHFYQTNKLERQSPKYPQLSSLRMSDLEPKKGLPARTSKCIVCGGDHWSTVCPSRFTVKPPIPCELCGGNHWKFACLHYGKWKEMVKRDRVKPGWGRRFGE